MYCKFCGKENPDDSIMCEECGNMLVDIFSASPISPNPVSEKEPPARSTKTKKAATVDAKQTEEMQKGDSKAVNKPVKITGNILAENARDYFFRIDSLMDVDAFVNLARESRQDARLSDQEKQEIWDRLQNKVMEVFGEEIRYYRDKGTFGGNLNSAFVCLVIGCIVSTFVPLIGCLFFIPMLWYAGKAFACLLNYPKATHAAKVTKTLERAGLYKKPD